MAQLSKKDNALQAIKFALFSASAGIIQVATFTVLNELVVPNIHIENEMLKNILSAEYGVCYLIALVMSVLWNFTFNRKFTFKDASNVPIAMLKVFLFYLVFTPLSTWGGDALVKIGWDDTLVLAITMVINFVTEFIYDDLFVFRKKKVEKNENAAE